MLFAYEITNNKGKIIKGQTEASSIHEARNKLLLQEGTLLSLEAVSQRKDKVKNQSFVFGRLRLLDKVMLAKHLSIMIKSGMAIDLALETLADNGSALLSKRLKYVLEQVRKGTALSEALKKYPKDFDLLFINMVAVGEQGGTLAKNLQLLAVQQQKSYELRGKLRAAAMYPTLVLFAVVGLTVVISIYVLPKIVNFFTSLKIELPLSTQILIMVSSFLSHHWLALAVAFMVIVFSWSLMGRFTVTRIRLHNFILHIFIIGKVSRNMNLALFCRTLASLLDSGITIDRALQIVSQTLTNDVFKHDIINVYHKVLKGSSLSDALTGSKNFPSLVPRMIKVGESSGNLSETLDYLADFYELEVDTMTKNLSTMLEPILLVIIGAVVGFTALSIINPIYDLTSQIVK